MCHPKVETIEIFNINSFGAQIGFSDNATPSIQAAIDAANISGGTVTGKPGTYLLEVGGTQTSRNFGLKLKSNVSFSFPGSELVIFKAANSTEMDVIVGDRTASTSNISMNGFSVDGNEPNQTDSGFNIWIYDSDDMIIDDVFSRDPGAFGFRLEQVSNLSVGTVRAEHSSKQTADGFHLLDVTDAVIDRVLIDTLGDDGFVIESNATDTHDISIGTIVVTAPVTSGAAGKGIYIVNNAANGSDGTQRKLYNISIANAITHNCKGGACVLQRGEFYNININLSDFSSDVGLNFIVGDITGVGVTGFVRNCNFNIRSWEPDTESIQMTISDGLIEYNTLDLHSYNPADGSAGAVVRGDYWELHAKIDYDPLGTKVSQSTGLDFYGSNSEVWANIDGGDTNLVIRGDNNVIHPTRLQNAATRDINFVSGADNNIVIGGSFTGSRLDSGSGNKFYGVGRGENYGVQASTPNGSGNFTISHGLATTPSFMQVTLRGDNANEATVQTVSTTTITVRIRNTTTNADVTSGTQTVDWIARL